MIQYPQNCFEHSAAIPGIFSGVNNVSSSTNKLVIIQRFERENLPGHLSLSSFLTPAGVELLTLNSNLLTIPYSDIKTVCFVKDLEASAHGERRIFTNRPKTPGLWVRMRFRDNDQMDGLLANNLLLLDPYGFLLTPPDPSSNSQRIFVPRAALSDFQVVAVIGSLQRGEPRRKTKPVPKEQIPLFES